MQRNPVHHPVDEELKSKYKSVTMHGDVMYYRKKRLFVCVSMPIGLVTMVPLSKSMTTAVLTDALETHITTVMSRGFLPSVVHLDPQKGFEALGKKVLGIEVDIGGAGDHVKIADNRIRHLKEIMRSVFTSLP